MDRKKENGFVLGGWSWLTPSDWDAIVISTDSLGNEQWHQYLGGPYKDQYVTVYSTSDSAILAVGAYAGYQSLTTAYRLYAAKLSEEGDVLWEKQYGALGGVTGFSSVTELSDGNFVAAGLYTHAGGDRGVLVKFAPNGDSLWMRTYQHPPLAGIFSVHWLRHAIEDPDGSIVATGTCSDGQQDLWVMRVDSFGCLVPGCQMYDHIAEPGAQPDALHILLYPNPANGVLNISFRSAAQPKQGVFHLFDAAGRAVRTFKPNSNSEEIQLDIRAHPPGLYLLQYSEARTGTRWSGRVIKE